MRSFLSIYLKSLGKEVTNGQKPLKPKIKTIKVYNFYLRNGKYLKFSFSIVLKLEKKCTYQQKPQKIKHTPLFNDQSMLDFKITKNIFIFHSFLTCWFLPL